MSSEVSECKPLLRGAMELAEAQSNFVVERTACFELG